MNFFSKQPASRQGTVQNVAYTGTAGTTTNPLGAETYQVRLSATSCCFYLITETANVVAATTSNGTFLQAGFIDYAIVSPGQKISVIQAATNGLVTGTAGTLNIVELS
jgi:hypothetical protein